MPECIEELIFGSGFPDFPYFSSGTGFYAIYENKPLFITAQHCLGKTNEEVEKNVSQLYLPIAPRDTPNRSTYDRANIVDFSIFQVNEPKFRELLPNGSLDIAVLKIDASLIEMNWIKQRAVYLPRTGEFLKKVEQHFRAELPSVMNKTAVAFKGFPRLGTDSNIDYESKVITSQSASYGAHLQWDRSFPHTYSLLLLPEYCAVKHLNGCSGAPVFLVLASEGNAKKEYALCGMLTHGADDLNINTTAHIVRVDFLCTAAKLALEDD
jgi:hypothetical protein